MRTPRPLPRSLRAVRWQARIPRIVAAVAVGILALAGLRTILAGPPVPPPPQRIVAPASDQGAASFAEAFARTYLSFDGRGVERREAALKPFLSSDLDADGGVRPGADVAQQVRWTAVLGDRRDGGRHLVTVIAQTDTGPTYLSVPVTRDARGFLAVTGYPALVGPPAADTRRSSPAEDAVEDRALRTVVSRALGNYLAANERNLLADLAPDAVVSLPAAALTVDRVAAVTWAVPGRRVAVLVTAADPHRTSWTLRYELDVVMRDRWYVRSLQVDPTFRGGS